MELWVLWSREHARRVLGHSRVLGSPYSTGYRASEIRTVLGEAGRRVLDMGTLRPRVLLCAVEAGQLSCVRRG